MLLALRYCRTLLPRRLLSASRAGSKELGTAEHCSAHGGLAAVASKSSK